MSSADWQHRHLLVALLHQNVHKVLRSRRADSFSFFTRNDAEWSRGGDVGGP